MYNIVFSLPGGHFKGKKESTPIKMKRIFSHVSLWLLCAGRHFVFGVQDQSCLVSDCECCIDKECRQGVFFPNECTIGCIDGHRGARCTELCENNCKTCPDATTLCESCYDQFYLSLNKHCRSCPVKCQTCTSDTRCTSCREWFENGDGSVCAYFICPDNCICDNSSCISCKNGFYDVTSLCSGLCPPNCLTCNSLEECNDCIEGYYNGYKTINGVGSLLRNCTHKCRETCKVCSSYDQCQQCKTGKYGNICQYNCSFGCMDNSCVQVSGECICRSNFIGEKCEKCITGKYGNYCNKQCPIYCKNNECDKVSGECTKGCVTTDFIGFKCETCIIGKYGEHCNVSCAVNCNNEICDRTSGDCTYGCKGNFAGRHCTDCIYGKYGSGCNLDCPNNCLNRQCDKQSGKCLQCAGNFAGIKCDGCIPGFYGDKCIQNCSPNCLHRTCDVVSGICSNGCEDNFYGDRCCVESKNCLKCLSNTECGGCLAGFYGASCNKSCPQNCKQSCDFETGICDDCKNDYYGSFCNLTCSEFCNNSHDVSLSRCSAFNGRCSFGCVDGHFGPKCDKTCSNYCIGRVCLQESGICVLGCECQHADPVCVLSKETQEQKDEPNTSPVATAAVLGSFLSLSLAGYLVLLALFVMKKIKISRRKHSPSRREPTYENQLENIGGQVPRTILATDTLDSGTVKRNIYEDVRRVNEQEHEYQQVSYDHGMSSNRRTDTDEKIRVQMKTGKQPYRPIQT